jgi:hypothetical protein
MFIACSSAACAGRVFGLTAAFGAGQRHLQCCQRLADLVVQFHRQPEAFLFLDFLMFPGQRLQLLRIADLGFLRRFDSGDVEVGDHGAAGTHFQRCGVHQEPERSLPVWRTCSPS